jgi:hypothetical protein
MFRRYGLAYLPCSVSGVLLCLWTGFIAEQTFVLVDRHSHSASDTLIGAAPIIGTLAMLLWLLAVQASKAES